MRLRTAVMAWNGLPLGAQERIVQRGAFDAKRPTDRGFARASLYGSQDGGQFFVANRLGPSAAFAPALGRRQAGLDAFLRQGALVLGQGPEHTEQERALWRG